MQELSSEQFKVTYSNAKQNKCVNNNNNNKTSVMNWIEQCKLESEYKIYHIVSYISVRTR